MSQTSKVSPVLRQQILGTFKTVPAGTRISNAYLMNATQYAFSLRKIQEATQKLTNEGVLTKTTDSGVTYYSLTPNAVVNTNTFSVGAAA